MILQIWRLLSEPQCTTTTSLNLECCGNAVSSHASDIGTPIGTVEDNYILKQGLRRAGRTQHLLTQ